MPLARTAREGRLWSLAGALLVAIYLSLYWVRPIAEWLRELNLLRALVMALFLLVAAGVLSWSLTRAPGPRQLAVLALFALLYLAIGWQVRMPEERIHLVEYGLLGALVYAALVERARPGGELRWSAGPAALAITLTALAGWLDEGIQYLLPNRHYDWLDVALNLVAGLLAVAALAAFAEARRRDRHRAVGG